MEIFKLGSFGSRKDSPLPLLFVARLLVLYLIWIRGMRHILAPFLPFWEGLDKLRGLDFLYSGLDLIYWVAVAAVLIGYRFPRFALLLAILVFFQVMSSKGMYSTSFIYAGCMLFLIGLFRPGLEWIFRVQIALLYFGAGFNKLLDGDWWSGQYFQNFIYSVYPNYLNLGLAKWVGLENLALFLSCFTIVTELSLAFWVLSQKWKTEFVLTVLLFHLGMLVFTLGELSYIYFFLMAATSYLTLDWVRLEGLVSKGYKLTTRIDPKKFPVFQKNKSLHHTISKKNALIQSSEDGKGIVKNKLEILLFNKTAFFAFIVSIVFISKYKHHLMQLFYEL